MDTLTTLIKFVGAGNSFSQEQTASTASTGDSAIWFVLLLSIFLAVLCVSAFLLLRKHLAIGNTSTSCQNGRKTSAKILLVLICSAFVFSALSIVGLNKAHATETPLSCTDFVGTVDEQTGLVSFNTVTVKNTNETDQLVKSILLVASDDAASIADVVWTISSDGTTIFQGKAGNAPDIFQELVFDAGEEAVLNLTAQNLTPEIAKSLINKNVASCNSSYKVQDEYYTGIVQTPVQAADGTVKDFGCAAAAVSFNYDTGNSTVSSVCNNSGKYTLLGAKIGSAGTISATKASTGASDDFGYSTDTFLVDTSVQTQTTAHIGAIKSLAVQVYQRESDGKNAGFKAKYWCPAFADGSLTMDCVKFYNNTSGQLELVKGTAGSAASPAYYMSDLTNLQAEEKSADNTMKAKYYAICKAANSKGEASSLHCYQVADIVWNKAFKELDGQTEYPMTAVQNPDFAITEACSDANAKLIYFDGSKDSETWCSKTQVVKDKPTFPPKVNGVNFSTDCTKAETEREDGWYETYGCYNGGLLSFYSNYVWAPFSASPTYSYVYYTPTGDWSQQNAFRASDSGLVLSRVFNN